MCTCESFVDGREREVNLKLGKENHRVKGSYNFRWVRAADCVFVTSCVLNSVRLNLLHCPCCEWFSKRSLIGWTLPNQKSYFTGLSDIPGKFNIACGKFGLRLCAVEYIGSRSIVFSFLIFWELGAVFFSVLVRQSKSYSTGAKNLQFTLWSTTIIYRTMYFFA